MGRRVGLSRYPVVPEGHRKLARYASAWGCPEGFVRPVGTAELVTDIHGFYGDVFRRPSRTNLNLGGTRSRHSRAWLMSSVASRLTPGQRLREWPPQLVGGDRSGTHDASSGRDRCMDGLPAEGTPAHATFEAPRGSAGSGDPGYMATRLATVGRVSSRGGPTPFGMDRAVGPCFTSASPRLRVHVVRGQ